MNPHHTLPDHDWNGARLPVCQHCGIKFGETGSNQPCRSWKPETWERYRKLVYEMVMEVRDHIKRKGL